MIHAHFVGMILKLLNIFVQHVLLHWLCGISLAFTFTMLPPKDSDFMYSIYARQEANKVIIFLILYGKPYIYSCSIQINHLSVTGLLCHLIMKYEIELNLAQSILGWRGFKCVQMKGHALLQVEIIEK